MAVIGTFRKEGDSYRGSISTITISIPVNIDPIVEADASDYVILHGAREIGKAWCRTNRDGMSYLALKIDDPAFSSPIYASLVKNGLSAVYDLEWSR